LLSAMLAKKILALQGRSHAHFRFVKLNFINKGVTRRIEQGFYEFRIPFILMILRRNDREMVAFNRLHIFFGKTAPSRRFGHNLVTGAEENTKRDRPLRGASFLRSHYVVYAKGQSVGRIRVDYAKSLLLRVGKNRANE